MSEDGVGEVARVGANGAGDRVFIFDTTLRDG